MFFFSIRFGLRQRLLAAAAAAVLAAGIVRGLAAPQAQEAFRAQEAKDYGGATTQERLAFLNQMGLEGSGEAVSEILIPKPFDQVYEAYNALQAQQGFDLERYQGKRVERYCYQIAAPEGAGVATLLVYQGKIIGGDLCIGGELYGFALSGAS